MNCWNRKISKIPQCSCPLSHNTLLLNITAYTSLQMWVIVGYEIGAFWGYRDWFIVCIVVCWQTPHRGSTWEALGNNNHRNGLLTILGVDTQYRIAWRLTSMIFTNHIYTHMLNCHPQSQFYHAYRSLFAKISQSWVVLIGASGGGGGGGGGLRWRWKANTLFPMELPSFPFSITSMWSQMACICNKYIAIINIGQCSMYDIHNKLQGEISAVITSRRLPNRRV